MQKPDGQGPGNRYHDRSRQGERFDRFSSQAPLSANSVFRQEKEFKNNLQESSRGEAVRGEPVRGGEHERGQRPAYSRSNSNLSNNGPNHTNIHYNNSREFGGREHPQQMNRSFDYNNSNNSNSNNQFRGNERKRDFQDNYDQRRNGGGGSFDRQRNSQDNYNQRDNYGTQDRKRKDSDHSRRSPAFISNSIYPSKKRYPLHTRVKAQNYPKQVIQRFPVYTDTAMYELGNQVGEGTYGQVFKAKSKQSGKFVALKKLYLKEDDKGKEKNRDGFPITGIREIEILRSLDHANIVKLQSMISMSTGPENLEMYMVFEYMDHDLTGILNNAATLYSLAHIKCLSQQLFEGLAYLHSQNIIHRDVKGANLLLNNDGYLKIADFGLARRLHLDRDSGEPLEGFEYTNRVVTLWYRSPELLLGSTSYGFEVDIWSAGCIIMEFYTKYAIFQGRTEIDQLELIFKICGSPTEENWPEMKELPWHGLIKLNHCERVLVKEFSSASYGLTPEFVQLLDQLLALNPTNRPTAQEALEHSFFSTEPVACKPSELPKIEGDWHEYEGKLRKKSKNPGQNPPPPLSASVGPPPLSATNAAPSSVDLSLSQQSKTLRHGSSTEDVSKDFQNDSFSKPPPLNNFGNIHPDRLVPPIPPQQHSTRERFEDRNQRWDNRNEGPRDRRRSRSRDRSRNSRSPSPSSSRRGGGEYGRGRPTSRRSVSPPAKRPRQSSPSPPRSSSRRSPPPHGSYSSSDPSAPSHSARNVQSAWKCFHQSILHPNERKTPFKK